MKKKSHLSIAIGIPTYVSFTSLVTTVASIRAAKLGNEVSILIVVDGKVMPQHIKEKLAAYDVSLYQKRKRMGQSKRIADLLELSRSDITFLTNDDVVFDSETIEQVIQAFVTDPSLTLVGVRVAPLPARSWVEHILKFRNNVVDTLIPLWRGGNNYLAVNGRCMALRTAFGRTLEIPSGVINSDAYIYIANQRNGGTFRYVSATACYFRNPSVITEHAKQSKKFQNSRSELSKHFGPVQHYFHIPYRTRALSFLIVTIRNPIVAGMYMGVYVYTRLVKQVFSDQRLGVWETDHTTKNISL